VQNKMIVDSSEPDLSDIAIPNFPYDFPFIHQQEFFEHRDNDVIMRSPTCSGKTDAFLVSFVNRFKESEKRPKCLYMAPTKLLMESQFENITDYLSEHEIKHEILRAGYTFKTLFSKLSENDFIISSPDIIFYILLRRGQHIGPLYEKIMNSLDSVVFDELHLFDTYILVNIKNLINIIKNIKQDVSVYLLSATMDLKDVIDPEEFKIIDGVSKTDKVWVKGKEIDYRNVDDVIQYLEENDFLKNTVYVANSVERAMRLHENFEDESSFLVGKMWYPADDEEERMSMIRDNLEKTKSGALTFATSVFRQGVDIGVDNLITEEPWDYQDAVQTFGRCGRRDESTFVMLTRKSPLLNDLNSEEKITRKEFEDLLEGHFRPKEYEEQKRMMTAMWYKLYEKTKLKKQVKFLITEEMKEAHEEFKDFLPDVSFREPSPSVKYKDLGVNLFDLLKFKGIWRNFYPTDDDFHVAELKDGGRLINRAYSRAKKKDLPQFTLVKKKRYERTDYYNLTLEFNGIQFTVNAKVGGRNEYRYKSVNEMNLKTKSFEPVAFFEGVGE